VKLSDIELALIGVDASNGPPLSDPLMPVIGTSEMGAISVPLYTPSDSAHLTARPVVDFVVGSVDALLSAEHVTASVVFRWST
jgi:hypothetical protein